MLKPSTILFNIAIIILMSSLSFGQEPNVDREIIVMFQPDILQLPTGKADARLDELTISVQGIRKALRKIKVYKVSKAFKDFKFTDTFGVSKTGEVVRLSDLSNIYKIQIQNSLKTPELIKELSQFSEVIYAEFNGSAIPATPPPDDPRYINGEQWNLNSANDIDIDAPEAWGITTGSSNIKIGVLDGGVIISHDDLIGRVTGDTGYGWDNHGTFIAGIIGAKTNNNKGIAGIDWNAQLISKKIDGTDDTFKYNAIMDVVINSGADILNLSWSICSDCDNSVPTPRYSTTLALALSNVYKLGVITVAAMAGYNSSVTNYPAGYGQGIIAVGATNESDIRWNVSNIKGSNYGNHIDVSAPGVNIISTYPFYPLYKLDSGTSAATPHVTGIASLLLSLNSQLYNDDVENIIRISAVNVPAMGGQEWTNEYGDGRVNARAALDLIRYPNQLHHWSSTGGTVEFSIWENYQDFYGLPDLQDGTYVVRRHTVEKTVNFPSSFSSTPYVWGRGVASTGYSGANPNFTMGFCEVVPGSITNTSARLRTYVYDVYIEDQYDGWLDYQGTYPSDPSQVVFGYTVLDVPSIVATAPSAPTNLIITNPTHYGNHPELQWWASSGATSYNVYRQESNTPPWDLIGSTTSTTYTDDEVFILNQYHWNSDEYIYQVKAVNSLGESDPSNTASVWGESYYKQRDEITDIIKTIPEAYALEPNYPNPFNPTTTIKYELPEASLVAIAIYDLRGNEVTRWTNSNESAGYKRQTWDATDKNGNKVPAGIYLLKLTAESKESHQIFTETRKMVLLK